MPSKLTTKILPQAAYRKLVSDIASIIRRAREKKRSRRQSDRWARKIRTYWQIGRCIVKLEDARIARPDHRANLVRKLSRKLRREFGTGFSLSNIKYAREFYRTYPKWTAELASGRLSWWHYCKLLAVNVKEHRDALADKVRRHKWSSRRLIAEVKKYKKALRTVPQKFDKNRAAIAKSGRFGIYKIITPEYVHPRKGNVFIDCGFKTSLELPLRGIKRPRAGDIVSVRASARGYTFKRAQACAKSLYTYVGLVYDVIDGDTIKANIDCGFDIWVRQKLRLRGIDAPDVKTKWGLRAKLFVRDEMRKAPFIVVKTYKTDIFNRYLADVFYLRGKATPDQVLRCGIHLNKELVLRGLAVAG